VTEPRVPSHSASPKPDPDSTTTLCTRPDARKVLAIARAGRQRKKERKVVNAVLYITHPWPWRKAAPIDRSGPHEADPGGSASPPVRASKRQPATKQVRRRAGSPRCLLLKGRAGPRIGMASGYPSRTRSDGRTETYFLSVPELN
jgi:hypothetical protein